MTRNDLFRRVLEKLEVTAAEEPADPGDLAAVERRYEQLHPQLSTENLCDWGLSEDIPDEFSVPVIAMLAHEAGPAFGRPQNPLEGALSLMAAAGGPSRAERMLRRMLAREYVSQAAQSEYF